jgi:hypothetical protein
MDRPDRKEDYGKLARKAYILIDTDERFGPSQRKDTRWDQAIGVDLPLDENSKHERDAFASMLEDAR